MNMNEVTLLALATSGLVHSLRSMSMSTDLWLFSSRNDFQPVSLAFPIFKGVRRWLISIWTV